MGMPPELLLDQFALSLRKSLVSMYSYAILPWRASWNCRPRQLPECSDVLKRYCGDVTAETILSPIQRIVAYNRSSYCSTLASLWYVLLIILAAASNSVRAQATEVEIAATVPPYNPYECRVAFDSQGQWVYVCGSHPDLFPILKYAEALAKDECERTFSDQKWKCDGFSLLKAPNITRKANREAAYVHALRFAAIAHTVAKACRELGKDGLLRSCSCDEPTVQTGGDTVACSDDVDFGLQFADRVLREGVGSTNRKEDLDIHNFMAGKMLVRELMDNSEMTCTCSGVSGSCTVKTCWNQLPAFSVVGTRIKQLYDDACLVQSNAKTGANFAWISECGRVHTDRDLLYNSNSPDFCRRDPDLGIVGVENRECDPQSDGPSSCASLCGDCGHDTNVHEETTQEQCQCHFHFCCEIRCDTCRETRTYYTCS